MDVIWAAVIGASAAWIGVYLQLHHASKERENERQMTLRRDVFLEGIRQAGRLLNYLFNFYSTTEPHSDDYAPAFQQVCLVGNEGTVQIALRLNDCLSQALLELIPEKCEIDTMDGQIKVLQEGFQSRSRDVSRWLEEKVQYEPQRQKDPQGWSTINQNWEVARSQYYTARKTLLTALNTRMQLVNALVCKCMERTREADRLLNALILAMRKELNCPLNEGVFQKACQVSEEQWQRNVEAYIVRINGKWQKLLADAESEEQPAGE